ncbi:MAG: 30S ribosomal protein S2, partial [Patescibacteria group bacterium]
AEAGAHFGHHRSLTFPKSKVFIYSVQSNVALINLEKTQQALIKAQEVFQDYQAQNKPILFVGTRRAVRAVTKEIAIANNCHYITERWFGGMLTNFTTILENIKRLNEQEEYLAGDKSQRLTKKERLVMTNKLERTKRFLGGVAKLREMPALLILSSASEDKIAIEEANQLGIPVVSITDTDMNPDTITYPIPANDDAPKAVELILRTIVAAPTKTVAKPKVTAVVEKTEVKAEKKTTTLRPAQGDPERSRGAKKVPAKKVASKNTAVKKPVTKKVTKKAVTKVK